MQKGTIWTSYAKSRIRGRMTEAISRNRIEHIPCEFCASEGCRSCRYQIASEPRYWWCPTCHTYLDTMEGLR